MGVRLLGLMSIAAAMVLLGLPSAASASGDQVDAIADGGFENSTCHDVDTEYGPVTVCESPSWTANDWQASICGLSGCVANAAHGDGYLQLGRAYMGSYSSMAGTASQTVDLPPGPKELTFAIRGNYDNPVTTLVASVEIDGNPVFTKSGGVDSSYADESIDLSDYTGEHEISFRADCEGVGMPVMRTCDGIAVDDVSLLVDRVLPDGMIQGIGDGSFEATSCATSGDSACTNPDWTTSPGFQARPCLSPPCNDEAATGDGFFGLGGAPMTKTQEDGSTEQVVDLPKGGPKLLSFALRAGTGDDNSTGTLTVRVGGDTLLTRSYAQAPSAYETETVDLRGHSGPTPVSFSVACSRTPASGPVGCDSFFVDDVSLPIRVETDLKATPPARTRSRHARFTFASSDPAAKFECRLDGSDLGQCTSPLKLRVDRGRHALAVRSVAGEWTENPGARYRWRVTKQR